MRSHYQFSGPTLETKERTKHAHSEDVELEPAHLVQHVKTLHTRKNDGKTLQ